MRKYIVAVACVLSTVSVAHADLVIRDIELATDASQIFVGGFGSGVFWRPTFTLEPFTLNVGDTIDVTVRLDQPVVVIAGAIEQESVGAFATSPTQSFDTTQSVQLDFLDVEGDLLSNNFSFTSETEGRIGGHTGPSPVDLTDTWFSFQGFHYSITINEGMGFPGMFDTGVIVVQTQGAIQFTAIPEPSGFSMGIILTVCSLALYIKRIGRTVCPLLLSSP